MIELDTLTEDQIDDMLSIARKFAHDNMYNKITKFEPDEWQLKAFALGKTEKVRGIMAANRIGKSYAATFELVCHLTGLYPEWWPGHKFDRAVNCLMLGESWSQIINPDAIHDLVFGRLIELGTGWIPKDKIFNVQKSGQLGTIAICNIQHISGQFSSLKVGTYQSGDNVLMGSTLDFVLIDECPNDKSILPQCVKRTWSSGGKVLAAFTPEKGLNDTVKEFWDSEGIYHSGLIHVTLFDSSLYTDEQKQMMVNSIPPWQQQFSIYGNPSAGQAAVFGGIMKQDITMPPPHIPDHWKRLSSIDFGFRDPNIVLFGTKDPALDVFYIYDELCHRDTEIINIAPQIVSRQKQFIPLVFPPDGYAERGIGTTLIKKYQECGVITTTEIAANWLYDPLGNDRSISTGIIHIRQLLKDGKLFISPACTELLKEFDLYQYGNNGKFLDKDNHAVDALRYLIMSFDKFAKDSTENQQSAYAYIPEEYF